MILKEMAEGWKKLATEASRKKNALTFPRH
jgi:hypothetical protein